MSEKFIKYSSLKNINKEKFMYVSGKIVPKDEEWCVMEKIHGSNIQIYYDEDGFRYGHRMHFTKGSFCNSHNVLPRYQDNMKKMYERYEKPIRIYGEIFGGQYDGKRCRAGRVQKGVEYCKEIEARFFDLVIGEREVPYSEAINIFTLFDIPFVQVLAICSLEEALVYPTKFPSTIPALYGLEVKESNICEGIAIKPYNNEYRTKGGSRVIYKSKNEKFTEKKRVRKPKEKKEFSKEANELIAIIESYITENRFNAVLSKQEYDKRDFGMFLSDFVKDVLEDAKNDDVSFEEIEKEERGRIRKAINKKAVLLIREPFFENIKERTQ